VSAHDDAERPPYRDKIRLPGPDNSEVTLDMREVSKRWRAEFTCLWLRYGEMEARYKAGEDVSLLAAEYEVEPDFIANLEGWPAPKRRLS
jgi:hypothetical protein